MKSIKLTTRSTMREVSVDAEKITHVGADPMMNSTVYLIGGTSVLVNESREEVLAAIESASRNELPGKVQRLEE